MLRPAQRRLVFLTAAFALSLLSCGREVTGPDNGIFTGRRIGSVAIAPEMPALMRLVDGASEAVPFTKVRVVLRNEDGSVARDTLVDFPSTADSVALSLLLPLPNTAPEDGLPLSLTMAYVNAAGDTVFRGGPNAIIARPLGSSGANVPVVIPVTWDGIGKDAASVVIAPLSGVGVAGTSRTFTATAFSAGNQPIANTPFVFFTLDETRVQVGAASGVATWLPVRGTARIVAALPNGLRADTAEFLVSLPASKLVLGSGNAQTGAVNAPLSDSIVVRTLASDDVPVAGVIVNFAVATGGGTLSVATDTSDANGNVSTRWTLGGTLGAQGITATATGLSGSPLAITATGVAGTPTRLDITAQPTSVTAGTAFAPIVAVTARDAFGNVATTFTGNVSIAVLGATPPTLGGTLTRAAVAGVATFNDLSLTLVGSYQLAVTSGSLIADTTASIAVRPAVATRLEFGVEPVAAVAGAPLAPPVTVRAMDPFGNLDSAFTLTVSLSLLNAGAELTLGGTASVSAVNGIASFAAVNVNVAGAAYALRASAGGLLPDTSATFAVTAAAASQLTVTTQPPDTVSGGAPFAFVVQARDAFGNASSFVDSATVSIQSGPAGAVLSGVTRRPMIGGIANFAGIAVDRAGSYQLAITAPGLTSTATNTFTARAGVPASIVRISGDAQSAPLNTTLPNPFVVEVRDAGGNIVPNVPVQWTVLSGDANVTIGTVLTDASGRSQTGLVLGTTLGTVTVRASATGAPAVQFTATILPGAAVYPNVVTAPSNGTANLALPTFSFAVYDQFDNLATGYSGVARVTLDRANILQPNPVIVSGDSVDVVAGVATWNALVVSTAGQYRIIADFGPTLGTYVSAIITIGPGAPAALVNVNGNGQTVGATATAANPLRARVTDASGNGVSGVNVIFGIISGSATLGAATVATDSSGHAQVSVTAGTSVGPVLIGAYAAGLTPDSVLYSLNVVAGAPASFVVLGGDGQTVPAGGTSDSVRIRLIDAFGNPVAGAAVGWNQTADLTFSPTGGVTDADGRFATRVTSGGQLGVKAFYATSPPASDIFVNITTVVGAADTLRVLRGGAQSGDVLRALDSAIVVRVADRFGNPRVGDTVIVSVASGGGQLINGYPVDTMTIDALGEASIVWTLGATIGTQSLTVTSGALTPLTITATGLQVVANRVWTGNASALPANPANWRDGLIPTATDSVLIPAGRSTYPTLATALTWGKLIVQDGATLDLGGSDLTVLGSIRAPLDVGVTASGSGRIIVQSGVATLRGRLPALQVAGNYFLAGPLAITTDLTIIDGGSLGLAAGDSVHVGANFTTSGSGWLSQTGSNALYVGGDALFNGGVSYLNANSRMYIGGNLSTGAAGLPSAFLADSLHTLTLLPNLPHTISFAYADTTLGGLCTASCLGRVVAQGTGTSLTFASNAMAVNGFDIGGIAGDIATLNGAGQYVIAGAPSNVRSVAGDGFRRFGYVTLFDNGPAFTTDTLVAFGSGTLMTNLVWPTVVAGELGMIAPHLSSLIVEGTLDIASSTARVNSGLRTRGNGRLRMTDATDSLEVFGELRFEGEAGLSNMTDGVIDARGNVFVGAGTSVMADAGHVLQMRGLTQTLTFADSANPYLGSLRIGDNTAVTFVGDGGKFEGDVSFATGSGSFTVSGTGQIQIAGRLIDPIGNRVLATTVFVGSDGIQTPAFAGPQMILRNEATLSGDLTVQGGIRIESGGGLYPGGHHVTLDSIITDGSGLLEMFDPADSVTVLQSAYFNGGYGILREGTLRFRGTNFVVVTAQGFKADPTHTTEFYGPNTTSIEFVVPGFGNAESHFGRVLVDKTAGDLVSFNPINVNGELVSLTPGQTWRGEAPFTPLAVRGANITGLTLDDQPLVVTDGAAITALANLRFVGFNGDPATQLRIAREVGGTVNVVSPVFDSLATEPTVYIEAEGGINFLQVVVSNPAPSAHEGRINALPTASIEGWNQFRVINWTGNVSNDWFDPGNWQQGVVPGPTDSVRVSSGVTQPVLNSGTTVRALNWLDLTPLSLSGNLIITQSFAGGSVENVGIQCFGSARVTFAPTDSARAAGWLNCPVHIASGVLRAATGFDVDSLIIEGTGEFHLRDELVNVGGTLRTAANGRLRMQGSSNTGLLRVRRNAIFAGGSTAGLMTTGTLAVDRNFTQLSSASPASFAPSGTHRTVLGDSAGVFPDFPWEISFASPAGSWFNQLYVAGGGYTILNQARSRGRTDLRASIPLSGARFDADSGFYAPASGVELQRLTVAGPLVPSPFFQADTVEFRGPVGGAPSQSLPSSSGDGSLLYQTILVADGLVTMDDASEIYRMGRLDVSSGTLLFGSGITVGADTASLSVTGAASIYWSDASADVTFDSVSIASSAVNAPVSGTLRFTHFVQEGVGNWQPAGSFNAEKAGSGIISFDDGPGGAFFNNLTFLAGSSTTLLSEVTAMGYVARENAVGSVVIQSNVLLEPSFPLNARAGLFFPDLAGATTTFRNVRLNLTGEYTVPGLLEFNNVTFERTDPYPTLATLLTQHTGTTAETWRNISFDTPLNSPGVYFQWDAVAPGASIAFQNAFPALDCLAATCTPGSNAPDGIGGGENVWTGATSSAWTDPTNWSLGVAPNAEMTVTIPASTPNTPQVSGNVVIGTLNVASLADLTIPSLQSLRVLNHITVEGSVGGAGSLRFTPTGIGNLNAPGSIGARLTIGRGLGGTDGQIVLNGPVNVGGGAGQPMRVEGGVLDLNGWTLDADADLTFAETGRLRMDQAASTLTARQTLVFDGASTDGYLTAGTMNVENHLTQSATTSASALVATGTHLTVFRGGLASNVTFATSDSTASRLNNVAIQKVSNSVNMVASPRIVVQNIVDWDEELYVGNTLVVVRGTLAQLAAGHVLSLDVDGFMTVLGVDPLTCNGIVVNVSNTANFSPQGCWDPPQLIVAQAPDNSGEAGGLLSPVVVELRDYNGDVVTGFTGTVSLQLANNPTSTIIFGTTSVAAVNGIATFNEVAIGLPGTGYTIRGTSAGFPSQPSVAFAVVDPTVLQDETSLAASTFQNVGSYCGVSAPGIAYCWGSNTRGTLGTGDTLPRLTPTAVSGGLSFLSISGGNGQICGIDASGDAYCWGRNDFGQVGNGSTSIRVVTPTLVLGGQTWRTIGTGTLTTCGLNTVGVAYCWGSNQGGRIGNGTETHVSTPTLVSAPTRFVDLSVGAFTACGRTAAGYLYCWGINTGHIGNGSTGNALLPVLGGGGLRYSQISLAALGSGQAPLTCGVTVAGANLCWGNNLNGGFANGGSSGTFLSPVGGLTGLVPLNLSLIEAGRGCATDVSGNASCWGTNIGSLGNGTFFAPSFTPAPVGGGIQFGAIVSGAQSVCGISNSGSAYCWGAAHPVALGGAAPTYLEPVAVPTVSNGATLELSSTGTACTRSAGGVASCWGANYSSVTGSVGMLATGSSDEFVISPQTLSGGESFVDLALGSSSCGVNTTGTLLCWGDGSNFGLASSSTPSSAPIAVSSALEFTAVSRGQSFGCALATTGVMSCWGSNTSGQLGRGTTGGSFPIDSAVGPLFDQIELGNQHGCGRTGTVVRCWGANILGQLGDGTTTLRPAPTVAVSGGHLAQSVYVGGDHSCLLTTTNEARCWGDGRFGQIGNGTVNVLQTSPVAPTGGLTFIQLALGTAHTCGLTAGGATYCWGSNSVGQVGDGTFGLIRITPTLVSTAPSFVSIRAGGNTTCGITSGEAVYCWGDGLGRFGVAPQLTPAPVAGGITFRTP